MLRQGAFARYIAGDAISMLGTWMQQMAQGWVIAGLTTTAFTLGLVTFFSSLPMLALTMFGGVIADRFDKRRILGATQIVQALLAVWVGHLVGTGEIRVLHIVIAGICLGISTAFEMPAAAALVPELVEREQLSAAIAVDRSVFHATRLIGPAVGGWLIGWLGTAWAFYANALSYSALLIALLTIRPRPLGEAHEEAARRTGMADGLAYVRRDKPTRAMISMLALVTFCISPFFMIMMPMYSRHVLHIPAAQHGILMGSSGIGAFAGSLWLLSIRKDKRRAWLIAASVGIVIAMSAVAAARGLAEAVVAMISLALGTSTVFGLANTIVQERAPDYIRGRVSAIAGLSFFGVLPFSGLIMSKFADLVGLRLAMGCSAVCFGLGAALMLYSHRRAEDPVPAESEASGVA